jgi:DNA-binding NarL/FixJ family response regulator
MHATRSWLESRLTALLLDAHELLRLGLRTLLEAQRTVTIVGEATTIGEAVARTMEAQPTLLITAAVLPDGDAAEACRRIAHKAPATRVVVLCDDLLETAMVSAVRAGASGYLPIHMRGTDLCRAIRAVATGESLLDARAMRVPAHRLRRDLGVRDHLFTLTPQERRVLGLVAEGKTNKEIGVALRLSEKTVKNYLSHAFEKLQVSRRSQAAVLFTRDQQGSPPVLSGARPPDHGTCVA